MEYDKVYDKICVNIFDKSKITQEISNQISSKDTYVAIFVCGQVRGFVNDYKKIIDGFNKLIESFLKVGKKPVIFFYVNLKSSYEGVRWHYKEMVRDGKFRNEKEATEYVKTLQISLKSFKTTLKKLNCDYVLKTYEDETWMNSGIKLLSKSGNVSNILNKTGELIYWDYIKENNLKSSSHFNQIACHVFCNTMKDDYESKKSLKFNQVIVTRPDLIIKKIDANFDSDLIYTQWDTVRVFPCYLYNYLICNVKEIMLAMKILSEVNEKLCSKKHNANDILTKYYIIHHIEKTFFSLCGFKYDKNKFPITSTVSSI